MSKTKVLQVTVYWEDETWYAAEDTTHPEDADFRLSGYTVADALRAFAQELDRLDAEDIAAEADPTFQAALRASLAEPPTRVLTGGP